jgi:hypothetical protein
MAKLQTPEAQQVLKDDLEYVDYGKYTVVAVGDVVQGVVSGADLP